MYASFLFWKETVNWIETIVVMHLFILSMILGPFLLLPPMLPTPWVDGNLELRMAGDKRAAVLLIGFLCQKSLLQQAGKSLHFTNHSG